MSRMVQEKQFLGSPSMLMGPTRMGVLYNNISGVFGDHNPMSGLPMCL